MTIQLPRLSPTKLHLIGCLVPFILTLILYASTTGMNFFELDDKGFVIANDLIKDLNKDKLAEILTKPYFANFSPLYLLSFALDYAIAGLSPAAFHLSSNIWAAFASVAVYWLAFVLTGRFQVAFFSAMIFAAHPSHVEAIVWISSRKDLIAGLFGAASMTTYILYRNNSSKKWAWYLSSIALFILAEAGKQSVVVLPVIFVVYDLLVDRRKWVGLVLDKAPYIAVSIIFALAVFSAQPGTSSSNNPYTIGACMFQNLGLLTGFGVYSLNRVPPNGNAVSMLVRFGLTYFPVLLALIPLFALRYFHPKRLFLYYFFMAAMLPPLFMNFSFPVTDRYLFFPSTAFCILLVWMLFAGFQRFSNGPKIFPLLMILLTVIFGFRSTAYIHEWQDPRSVWYGAVQKTDSARTHMMLGGHYENWGIRLVENKVDEDALREMASTLLKEAEVERLVEDWQANGFKGKSVKLFYTALISKAWDHYEKAVNKNSPSLNPRIYLSRGRLQLNLKNLDKAEAEFITAWEKAQKNRYLPLKYEISVRSFYGRALVYMNKKDYPKAREYFQRTYNAQEKYGMLQAKDPTMAYPGNWITGLKPRIEKLDKAMKESKAAAQPPPE